MRLKALFSSISLACVLAIPLAIGTSAQATLSGQISLSGQVSSAEEGLMEGVLVSAKKDGSSVTTTVVSNDKGQYSFPPASSSPAATPSASARRATISWARRRSTSRPGRRRRPT